MSALRSDELLPALNTDVLIIIFEHFLDLNGSVPLWENGFLGFRLLSKQMNELILAIGYRTILLDPGLLDSFTTYLQVEYELPVCKTWRAPTPHSIDDRLNVAEYIYTFTQHVAIDSMNPHLRWSWLPDMLYNMQNLKQLTWSYWGPTYDADRPIQYEVLGCSPLRAQLPKLRISVVNFYAEKAMEFHSQLADLVSCTDDYWRPMYFSRDHIIEVKRMLLASPNMETFDMVSENSRKVGVDWDIRDGEKLPPFKDLKLQDICWYFSPVEAVTFWDWSRIAHLRMTGVHIIDFLRTGTPEYLSGLRTFKTDCWGSEKDLEEASNLLCNLVNNIAALQRLQMRCLMRSHLNQCFSAIINYGRNLRSLSLRDFHRADEDPQLYSVLPVEYLKALCSACPYLTRLDIDVKLNVGAKGRSVLSSNLASFRNLRVLKLHAWMSNPFSDTNKSIQWAIVIPALVPWVKDLYSAKQGVGFDRLHLFVEMRHVTALAVWKDYYPERLEGLNAFISFARLYV